MIAKSSIILKIISILLAASMLPVGAYFLDLDPVIAIIIFMVVMYAVTKLKWIGIEDFLISFLLGTFIWTLLLPSFGTAFWDNFSIVY